MANFGDGMLSVFDADGNFIDMLRDKSGEAIEIEGLWGTMFTETKALPMAIRISCILRLDRTMKNTVHSAMCKRY